MCTTQSFLHLLCLRHGKTEYTGILPDLTPQGVEETKRVANNIVKDWIKRSEIDQHQLRFVSSPATCALSTAQVIASEIGHSQSIIHQDELGPKEQGETKSDMRERLFDFLTTYVEETNKASDQRHRVLVSHFEVFSHLTHELFGIAPSEANILHNVEHIELTFFSTVDKLYLVKGDFRGHVRYGLFDANLHLMTTSVF